MKVALFPGSFDPLTIAHVDILKRALPLFDKVVIGIGSNSSKASFLSEDKRKEIVSEVFKDYSKIEVQTYEGLTINFCKKMNAQYMLRGIRSVSDFEYERPIAQVNKTLHPQIETIFVLSRGEYSHISSTIVREILMFGGDVSKLVPPSVINLLK